MLRFGRVDEELWWDEVETGRESQKTSVERILPLGRLEGFAVVEVRMCKNAA